MWEAVARSIIGVKHIEKGIPCQDSGDYRFLDNGKVLIGVVSDGMGSAKHSEIGSHVAVETALSFLTSKKWLVNPLPEQQAQKLFQALVKTVQVKLQQRAAQESCVLKDLACTLLVCVATPNWLTAMQVGDGQIVVRQKGKERDYQLLFSPDKGEYANVTTPVTSSRALHELQVRVIPLPCHFICMASDGIENISLIKHNNWTASEKFFAPLEEYMLSERSQKEKEKGIEDFLSSAKINSKTNDDKTLLLGVYQENISDKDNLNVIQAVQKEEDKNQDSILVKPSSNDHDQDSRTESNVIISIQKQVKDAVFSESREKPKVRFGFKKKKIEIEILSRHEINQEKLVCNIYNIQDIHKNSLVRSVNLSNYDHQGETLYWSCTLKTSKHLEPKKNNIKEIFDLVFTKEIKTQKGRFLIAFSVSILISFFSWRISIIIPNIIGLYLTFIYVGISLIYMVARF